MTTETMTIEASNIGRFHYLHGSIKIIYHPVFKLWVCIEKQGKLRMFSSGRGRNKTLNVNLITGKTDSYEIITQSGIWEIYDNLKSRIDREELANL